MYVHMFAFRWKPEVTPEQKKRALVEISGLQGQVPGLLETPSNLGSDAQGTKRTGVDLGILRATAAVAARHER